MAIPVETTAVTSTNPGIHNDANQNGNKDAQSNEYPKDSNRHAKQLVLFVLNMITSWVRYEHTLGLFCVTAFKRAAALLLGMTDFTKVSESLTKICI